MNQYINTILVFNLIYMKKYIISVIIGLTLIGGYIIMQPDTHNEENKNNIAELPKVAVKTLENYKTASETIKTVGVVESLGNVELKSEMTAPVKDVFVTIGDEVKKGDLLVVLEHDALNAQISQAQASIDRIQGNLDQAYAGKTDEVIAQAQASVNQAKASLNQSKQQFEQIKISNQSRIRNAELAVIDAQKALENTNSQNSQNNSSTLDSAKNSLRNAIVTVNTVLVSNTKLQYTYFNCSDILCANIKSEKEFAIEQLYNQSNGGSLNEQTVASLQSPLIEKIDSVTSKDELITYIEQVKTGLESLKRFVIAVQTASSSYLGNDMLSTEKSKIASDLISVDTLITQINSAKNSVLNIDVSNQTTQDARQIAYQKAVENLELLKKQIEQEELSAQESIVIQETLVAQAQASYDATIANPREVDLSSLKASVRESQAALSLIATNKEKAFFYAPFDGVVASLSLVKGDLVTSGMSVVSIVNDETLSVTAFVNEKDYKYIAVGNTVMVEDRFSATISHIAPSLDPINKKVEVIIEFNEIFENELLIDQFVNVELEMNTLDTEQSYFVPLSALKQTLDGSSLLYVMSEEDKYIVKSMPVTTSDIIGENIIISSENLNDTLQIIPNPRGVVVDTHVELIQ